MKLFFCRSFRNWRLLALSRALSSQGCSPPGLWVRDKALTLTAACVWLINCLHARPDDGPSSRALMEAVLPLTDDEDIDQLLIPFARRNGAGRRPGEEEEEESGDSDGDEEDSLPYFPFGAIFLRRIVLNRGIPRMRAGGRTLNDAAFQRLFGASREEIDHRYNQPGIMPTVHLQHIRPGNKSRRTNTHVAQPGGDPVLFSLAEHGYSLPPPVADEGSDMDVEENEENQRSIDEHLTQIFNQFIQDIFQKAPNSKGASKPSYCTLDRAARLAATEDLLKHKRLSELWNAYQYKSASTEDFEAAFNHMFPPRDHVTGKTQGYTQCTYYLQWKKLCSTAPPTTADVIHLAIKKRVLKLAWIPHACQDKLWPTSAHRNFTRVPPGPPNPAPRILIRGRPEE